MTLKVTLHAITRYNERIIPDGSMTDAQVDTAIRQRIERAVLIFSGTCGTTSDGKFYLDDDTLFVVKDDQNGGAVVTLYRPEYGFGEEIDAIVRRRLLKSVKGLQERIAKTDESLRESVSTIDRRLSTLDAEAATLRAELERVESAKAAQVAKKAEVYAGKRALETRLAEEARKLILAKNYGPELYAATINGNRLSAKK